MADCLLSLEARRMVPAQDSNSFPIPDLVGEQQGHLSKCESLCQLSFCLNSLRCLKGGYIGDNYRGHYVGYLEFTLQLSWIEAPSNVG